MPNGHNLTIDNRSSWVRNKFSRTKINIKFEIEIVRSDSNSKIKTFSDETIYSIPGLKLKDVLIKYVTKVKKQKSEEYDAICST